MKNFLLRLMRLIAVPLVFVSYSLLMTIPLAIIILVLIPINIVTYLFMDKFVYLKWLPLLLEPMCVVLDWIVGKKQ
jgi:hypothetical protein